MSETGPVIGNINPLIGVVGNTVIIFGRGFGNAQGIVKFGNTTATVQSWSDSCIKIIVPNEK